ncbi:MAG: bifunctional 4-hydroxy-2-oxoglutarate aldolase/2-dehydro-3-deoxy-phosphogluconate aldolase [Phycisphaeraceae bacterium]|nr:bifunctional 4-hydroxy-2-oxoglutarate aldolase/2-dehydro-3-deoxy-phosphogluconate aldolase [Phycisphaeraceae bacterium]
MSQSLRITGRQAIVAKMETTGIVAVIRADGPDQLVNICKSLAAGGVDVSEITMTTPGALKAIEAAADQLADKCLIGVGSVLDPETARLAILAGAQYIVSPTTNLKVIEMANRYGTPIICGAMTPTEIITAFQAGADIIKVFPANHFGPQYLKDLLAPMPQLKLIPTGGVDMNTAKDWIAAGACCLGVGSALVKKDLIKDQKWDELTTLAAQFIKAVKGARTELGK